MSRSVRGPDYGLRIYPKHPAADAYKVGGAYEPYAVVGVDKRFSGSELAAEWWLLYSREQRMLGYQDGKGSATESEADKARERQAIVERFATLPHFDEVNE